MISRDLNYTISFDEVWGRSRKVNAMADHIKDIIVNYNFMDICPTWDNGRSGDGYVSKRLDHFLLDEHII